MSKSKTETKPTTAEALEAAQAALAKSAGEVDNAEHDFELDQSQESWARLVARRAEHSYFTRCADLAQSAFDSSVRAEQDRIAAEAEAKRVAALLVVQSEIAASQAEAVAAARVMARALAFSWDGAIREQGLGGLGRNDFAFHVNSALRDALIDCGMSHGAITVN